MLEETILAVDPSLRGTGYAVLVRRAGKVSAAEFGRVTNSPTLPLPQCLLAIHARLDELILRHSPGSMAVESVIYVQSYRTAIALGSARGAVLLSAAQRGLAVHEYAPRKVKQAVVGRGAAHKQQVGFMVRALLGLTETPQEDAADAIAVGLTHFAAIDSTRAFAKGPPVSLPRRGK